MIGIPLDEFHAPRKPPPRLGEHVPALVESDHRTARAPDQLRGDRAGSGGHVQHRVTWPCAHSGDEEPTPARVLPEREERRVAVVGRPERGEQRLCVLPSGRDLRHSFECTCPLNVRFGTLSVRSRAYLGRCARVDHPDGAGDRRVAGRLDRRRADRRPPDQNGIPPARRRLGGEGAEKGQGRRGAISAEKMPATTRRIAASPTNSLVASRFDLTWATTEPRCE
jgi:hypothetical protein